MILALLLACAADKPAPLDDSRVESAPPETGHTGDTGESGDTGLSLLDCAMATGLELTAGEAEPGVTLSVALTAANLPSDAALSWSADAGEVLSRSPGEAEWALPGDMALHIDEDATLTVEISAEGCQTERHELTVIVSRPESDRVIVLYNPSVDRSEEVARAYAASRGIADDRLCGVTASDDEWIPGDEWPDFADAVQACIDAAGEQIHYIAPVYGVPYRVSDRIADIGTGGAATTSVDALLVYGSRSSAYGSASTSTLYQYGDSMAGEYDPYIPIGDIRQTSRTDLYLVARLDGVDADAALALIERAELAQALADTGALSGTVYVDAKSGDSPPATDDFGSYDAGDWNMWGTAAVFDDAGLYPVVFDTGATEFGTDPSQLWCDDALYYAGWYSYYNYNDAFAWTDGAVGGHLDSCSACSLRDGATWSSGALEHGITATFGAVSEPYVAGMPEYDQFFLYLLQGADFAEAGYESTRLSRWMMVWVGDPLYRPYPTAE